MSSNTHYEKRKHPSDFQDSNWIPPSAASGIWDSNNMRTLITRMKVNKLVQNNFINMIQLTIPLFYLI